MAHFDNNHRRSKQQFDNNSQNPDVVCRHSGISGEESANGQVAHEALPMLPENPLEVSRIIGQKDTMFTDFEKESDLVENKKTGWKEVTVAPSSVFFVKINWLLMDLR